MAHDRRRMQSTANERGVWMRNVHMVEHMPSFGASLPEVLAVLDVDRTEPTAKVARRSGPVVNRGPATPTGTPPRHTAQAAQSRPVRAIARRPRPSPLFGEGELDGLSPPTPAPGGPTAFMGERPNTLWETDLTDPGRSDVGLSDASSFSMQDGPPVPEDADESVTLEVDPAWRAQLQRIDAAFQDTRQALHTSVSMQPVPLVQPAPEPASAGRAAAGPRVDDLQPEDLVSDDLLLDDLQLDLDDARNRVRLQTAEPVPLARRTRPVALPSLAQRAPAPVHRPASIADATHGSAVAPVPLVPGMARLPDAPRIPVDPAVRLAHAAQAAAWFFSGAAIFGGTGATLLAMLCAVLFAG